MVIMCCSGLSRLVARVWIVSYFLAVLDKQLVLDVNKRFSTGLPQKRLVSLFMRISVTVAAGAILCVGD